MRPDTTGRFCVHGQPEPMCEGTRLTAPCLPSEYTYCAHGVDQRKRTKDGASHCSYCRGVTRRHANPDTWRPPGPSGAPAPDPQPLRRLRPVIPADRRQLMPPCPHGQRAGAWPFDDTGRLLCPQCQTTERTP